MTTSDIHADLSQFENRSADEKATGDRAVWHGTPPTTPRTLWDIFCATADQFPGADALDDGQRILTYSSLKTEVEELRSRLFEAGIRPGDRVGVRITSGTARLYCSILAVLASGAAYVPVDVDDPPERAELIWSEAAVDAVLGGEDTVSRRSAAPGGRPVRTPSPNDDAWIIFTSGTTGTPKGVAVSHRAAAAFVDAEARLFVQQEPLGPGDRVLAGLSVGFDASCEEMWLAWRSGACLVPAPRAVVKSGAEIAPWLAARGVNVVSTVPTLVSLWPVEQLGRIRLLILGGEACPAPLADRLTQHCAEVWNTYGPTETTVVACAAQLQQGDAVRIGLPLPGWQLAVVDPETGIPVRWGETGELVIGGVGVARYLDAAKDAAAFGPVARLGWPRAYRSGDCVRADADGLVYVGRTDTQVKIRGYRIELGEIESAMLAVPGISQAVVATYESSPGLVELVGYYAGKEGDPLPDPSLLHGYLRNHLPAHMVPAFLERLSLLPMAPSGKVDRKSLPPPSGKRSTSASAGRDGEKPRTELQKALASVLIEVLALESVSVDDHFFDDLGANSLLIAQFCAKLRDRADLPPVSTKDVYLHPTVRALARSIASSPVVADQPASVSPRLRADPVSNASYVLCGTLQMSCIVAAIAGGAWLAETGAAWISAARGVAALYLRSLAFGGATFLLLCVLPIAAKWILVGHWRRRYIRLWSFDYFRFWLVKTLIRTSPLAMLAGSPIYVLYLRALGARIGRGVVLLSRTVPICTDLLSIGDNAVVRGDASFAGYHVRGDFLVTGPVRIGTNAYVGERAVLDIDTSLGDGAQLGHSSALHPGQSVPSGERWHGSPGEACDVDYRRVRPVPGGSRRRNLHAVLQAVIALLIYVPVATGGGVVLLTRVLPPVASGAVAGPGTWWFYERALTGSLALFFGGLLAALALVTTLPRLLNRFLRPDRTYPLYGVRHLVFRAVRRLTNASFLQELVGDSSYVVHYLRALGYRLPDVEQTGSNFGADLRHDSPFLSSVGRGTMISDGASLLNADYSSTSFRLTPVVVGSRSFLGNALAYPAGARIGDNCLVGTKTMVPLDGPVRENVGLLGSPCFEIPRTVRRDHHFSELTRGAEFARRLSAKNAYNLRTMALFLTVRWFRFFVMTLLAMAGWAMHRTGGAAPLAVMILAGVVFGYAFDIVVERSVTRFRSLRPRFCSIYDPHFWWHERYWKLLAPHMGAFNGTPLKGTMWRLLGVQVGRRLFDDGCSIAERSLVEIGDDCSLNAGTVLQCHSMEDGTFKSDRTVVGDRCTLGVGAFVHYGVTIESGAELLADSFLMKGEVVGADGSWGGNPARAVRELAPSDVPAVLQAATA